MFQQRDKPATEEELQAEREANAGSPEPGSFLVQRDPYIPPRDASDTESSDKVQLFKGEALEARDAPQAVEIKARHTVLMACLEEEGERQAEERQQAQIDDDYYHHLQWTAEQARVLVNRGQAPLVFNEARSTIDWLCGTERRLRKDYKIRPRSKDDEQNAEFKTKAFKYIEDVNLAPWHRSKAAKQMFTSGLGWLEEGINTDPEKELIFCGSEDWRRIFRDSRAREFDLDDCRYIHRRKILDLDYATALLPKAANHLKACAGRWGTSDEDEAHDTWYLGERLTNANTQQWAGQTTGIFGDAYTVRNSGSGIYDHGRRSSVEIIETWYRVPERVKVFSDGPLFRKVVNPNDPRHQQLMRDKTPMYEAVKWRMRCMVGTMYEPCWDGVSPYTHGRYSFVPMWGYRRGRDGLSYGSMRGMRDAQDDLNKRRSKALFALSVNRIIVKVGSYDNLEDLREEGARADGVFEVPEVTDIKFEKFQGEVTQNMELAEADRLHIRSAGGVTGDNLGQDTSAISGKAIIAKQEQGSLTTFELFDNYLLAFKLAGQIRLAHIEQFCNQEWEFRLDPAQGQPHEWVTVNKLDPRTGQYLNDITAGNADFIVDQQDYRATLTQTAMQSMFELLTQIATFAPQVVMNLLDLVVDSADIPGKDVWVQRIRKITGQRDPSKPPTPEEQQQDQESMAKQQQMEAVSMQTAQAQLDVLKTKVTDQNAAAVLKSLQGLLAGIEAAATIATMPGVAAAADGLAKAAGFEDKTPADGVVVATPDQIQPAQPAPVAPAAAQPGAMPDQSTMADAMAGEPQAAPPLQP